MRTPVFDENTLPAALRREHRTKPGVWGVIRVLDGRLSGAGGDRAGRCTSGRYRTTELLPPTSAFDGRVERADQIRLGNDAREPAFAIDDRHVVVAAVR